MFRPLLGHLQALRETDPRAVYIVVLLTDTFVFMCYNTSGWKTLKFIL